MLLYEKYPELMLKHDFTSADVSNIAKVSPEKQRQYRHQGFTPFLESKDDSKHPRYNWEEVSLWALMAECNSYGFDLPSAGYFAAAFSDLSNLPYPEDRSGGGKRQHLIHDHRIDGEIRKTPLYVLCFPTVGKPETFLQVSMTGKLEAFDGNWLFAGRFGFWINYSDFQRRLLLRYEGQ